MLLSRATAQCLKSNNQLVNHKQISIGQSVVAISHQLLEICLVIAVCRLRICPTRSALHACVLPVSLAAPPQCSEDTASIEKHTLNTESKPMSIRRCGICGLAALLSTWLVGCKPSPGPQKPNVPSTPSAPETRTESQTSTNSKGPELIQPVAVDQPADTPQRLAVSAILTLPVAQGPDDKLSMDDLRKLLDDPKNHEPIIPQAPVGLGDVASFVPRDNPMTRAKVELGRMLYFDKRLSRDSTVACATCHDPSSGWAQNRQFAAGIAGQEGGRNSPTVMNRIFGTRAQFWDGRAASLEEQSLGPIQNPIEMGFELNELVERLKDVEGYRLCFAKIFTDGSGPGEVSAANIAKAIATFERTVMVGESPYDYFNQAEPYRKLSQDDLDADPELAEKAKAAFAAATAHPISESARRGRDLFFGKANCTACHAGVNFADELFYNIGVSVDKTEQDMGRLAVTKNSDETGAFKTPTIRNVALTAPYMHDGSQKTLMDVVEHYDRGGTANPHLSQRMKKLGLSQQEKEDLVAYMTEGLTGTLPDIRAPKLP
jgi:cytochrome c peroxidase